jgi:hypothetical protein
MLTKSRIIHYRGGTALAFFLLFKLVTLGIFQTPARQVLKQKKDSCCCDTGVQMSSDVHIWTSVFLLYGPFLKKCDIVYIEVGASSHPDIALREDAHACAAKGDA